jgi:hypothetical protein
MYFIGQDVGQRIQESTTSPAGYEQLRQIEIKRRQVKYSEC